MELKNNFNMKKITTILLLLCSLFANAQNALTNKSILDMIALGFSDDIIVTKIKTSQQKLFCTEIDSLKSLKEKGVSDAILVSMMETKEYIREPKQEKGIVDSLGIGLFIMDASKKFIKVNPSIFSGTKTNTLAAAFTYGLADSEIASTLDKPYSATYTKCNNPSFFFFFADGYDNAKITTGNYPFINGTSPNEFVLAKLHATSKKRKLRTGKVNLYAGMSMGINEDDIISFSTIQINSNAFKVILNEPLPVGEYGFIYQGTSAIGVAFGNMIYDFSIEE